MATAAHSIVAPALKSAANDTGPVDWTRNPVVRKLLASFATNPPPIKMLARHERWDGFDYTYTGYRVAALQVLRTSIVEPAYAAAEARGDLDAACAVCASPSVFEAVQRALCIPTLRPITVAVRDLNPAAWGDTL
ncbi:hypothetical protein Q5H91_03590 [Sphingomonas sp. KR1UV-12]|uniref:Uncharacterized protein n=1 Tax=Sphingomonas aurea TaxID=3063994 RepID=A0ABT9EH47_9SPHN|nr:hypothetical protein [Sphingomonas sp. KR1UV-12]MDP1026283.1 hypothetical protein [Sphingomonas sp. KR1UV-12]